jgi:hypothetical protein
MVPNTDARDRDSRKNQRRIIHDLLTPLDLNPDAMHFNIGQSREQKIAYLCGFSNRSQRPATSDRTLVMSRSAVLVRSSALFFTCKTRNNEQASMVVSEALSAVHQQ